MLQEENNNFVTVMEAKIRYDVTCEMNSNRFKCHVFGRLINALPEDVSAEIIQGCANSYLPLLLAKMLATIKPGQSPSAQLAKGKGE